MLDDNLPRERRITLAADKGYYTRDFVRDCRDRNVTPDVAPKAKHSRLDASVSRRSSAGPRQSAAFIAPDSEARLDHNSPRML